MRVGIVVPDGIGIKNYLYSDLMQKLVSHPDVEIVLIHKIGDQFLEQLFAGNNSISFADLNSYNEPAGLQLIREAICYARLKYFTGKLNNPTILEAFPKAANKKRKIFYAVARALGMSFSGSYNAILRLEKKYKNLLAKTNVTADIRQLETLKIDVLLGLNQRALHNIPLYEAARRLGIRRTTVIYSWDNVSKARLYADSDVYMLWSSFMKEQMQLFYPEIPEGKLAITGTPQFSFYKSNEYLIDVEEFCRGHNINPTKPVILFSGSDSRTSPYDPQLLQIVAKSIAEMPADKRPQIIFRRTPADFSGRYDAVLQSHLEIIKIDPVWTNKDNTWFNAIPTKQDIKNLRAILALSQLVINVSSTMALDAAVMKKPCIYLAFTPKEGIEAGFSYALDIHREDHFKVMRDINAVEYADNASTLGKLIADMIERPDEFARGRYLFLEKITDNLIEESTGNIERCLLST